MSARQGHPERYHAHLDAHERFAAKAAARGPLAPVWRALAEGHAREAAYHADAMYGGRERLDTLRPVYLTRGVENLAAPRDRRR